MSYIHEKDILHRDVRAPRSARARLSPVRRPCVRVRRPGAVAWRGAEARGRGRQLKPDNVLLVQRSGVGPDAGLQGYTIKLADFGIAKLVQGQGRTKTAIGTENYLAPEVRRPSPLRRHGRMRVRPA